MNDLDYSPILNLSANFQQIVRDCTRLDPPALLDPMITTLHQYYQRPECVAPLDADPEKGGSPSDHKIVIARPISTINNKCNREYRIIKVRPLTETGMKNIENWFVDQTWHEVYEAKNSDEKAFIIFHDEISLHL